ncbi:siderophore-iron reductase FhuF [Halomonas sp. McH1-25]|uniref:siderophore-iron reductase FhuF n=1 Tax=unclassified Halomonas TaxID=2609666 RepID=UPI001EF5716D|nr:MULTISPECIES: siderophore-iron reductase FhuF [unclassified Halomonas]MCG7599681.1 siderophore-iron reductase FhuF [Halomonas sp. McH1-25]MCP1344343.1 siderophore-iron reductase FhuF [Halomonas sp. FL8]MCP1362131.1 siderophore-iron reductase FhuF [Halomonas sp. BBD45]MCP1365145.1 siderophore-iron reductase FhuF [Halomonas sp. BBD48]
MLPTLSALFQGPFAALHDRVLLPSQARGEVVPVQQLFSPQGLDEVLERYAVEFMTPVYRRPDRRALMSQWSKYFLAYTVSLPVAANLLLDRRLPVTFDTLGVQLDELGLAERLVVAHEGEGIEVAQGDVEARLRPLMDDLLGPAIAAMTAHTGIGKKALWSNAGHYYAYLIDQLQALPERPSAVNDGAHLMNLPCFADGERNPLYRPVRQVENAAGDTESLRRVCCVRYKLPGLDYCGNCPLPAACAMRREPA